MSRVSIRAFCRAAIMMAAVLMPGTLQAQPLEITATPINVFQGAEIGQPVGELIWLGGLVLDGPEATFGGISGITFLDDRDLVMVTDKGNFISARIASDAAGSPAGLSRGHLVAIQNSRGDDLPANYSRDAEAVETIVRSDGTNALRVGFENLTRVADFDLEDGLPIGPAREVSIPDSLGNLRTNESLEAVCIAPEASPVAGSTMLIAESLISESGEHSAWLLGNRDKGALFISVAPGFNPTDCDFLPNGDLLVLERGTGFLSFTMQVRRFDAADVRPDAHLDGQIVLQASGGDIDNMEGLAVRVMPGGEVHLVIVSDDNFNDWERTLWLEFAVPNRP